ncbi:hypothetical protein CHAN_02125 [Corynebacterium hansenii]|nr:hypothetical protein CHAN_02125 [Corynebacterium hansenii]
MVEFGDGMRMSDDRVVRVASEVTGRAGDGDGRWVAVPGFRPFAAGLAFFDRGARLEAAVEAMRGRGRRAHGELAEYAPAVAAQFAALEDADSASRDAVGRIDVSGGDSA